MTGRTPAPSGPPGWQVWAALGLVYLVWGSTYLAISYVVRDLPPLLSAGARFLAASALLAAYVGVRRGRQALRAPRAALAKAAGVGLLLLLGGNGLVVLGEHRDLPSGLTALLVAGVPFWVVLLRAARGDRPRPASLLGVLLGFAGVAVLLLPGARPAGVSLLAAGLVVGASLSWSVGSYWASLGGLPDDPLLATAVEMLGGGAGLLATGLAGGERLHLSGVGTAAWVALAYLVLFGSLVAFTAYSWLLGVAPVSKVATYAYVNPVVAVVLGALVAGEPVRHVALAGGAVTVLAVAVVVREEARVRLQSAEGQTPAQAPTERQGRARSSTT